MVARIEISTERPKLDLIERDLSFGFRLAAAIKREGSGPVIAQGENGQTVEVGRITND